MTEHSDPRKIEADIERDRAALGSALDTLQDRMSVDNLASQALGMVKTNAQAYTKAIDDAVRANPLALALTGVGLAWLIFGGRKAPGKRKAAPESLMQWEDDGGPVTAVGSIDTDWSHKTDALRRAASATLRKIENEARDAATAVGDGLAAGTATMRDFAAERAAVVADFAAGLQRSFGEGLGGLSEAAQTKIASAREAAYGARIKAENAMHAGTRQAGRVIEDHPMVSGAIALGLGAALAAALPRTQTEDSTLGLQRDKLMDAAARLLADERERATKLASDVSQDLKSAAKGTADAVADTLTRNATDALDRVKDRIAGDAPAEDPMPKPASVPKHTSPM